MSPNDLPTSVPSWNPVLDVDIRRSFQSIASIVILVWFPEMNEVHNNDCR
jgi:hypothetical protein